MKLDRKFNEKELEVWREYQQSLQRWQECSCRPQDDAYLCPVCVRYTKEKYGDDIPYGGE